jgi:hypothetical protein
VSHVALEVDARPDIIDDGDAGILQEKSTCLARSPLLLDEHRRKMTNSLHAAS